MSPLSPPRFQSFPLFACRPHPKKAKALRNRLNARRYRVKPSASLFAPSDVLLATKELAQATLEADNYLLGGLGGGAVGAEQQIKIDRDAAEVAAIQGAGNVGRIGGRLPSRRKLTKMKDSEREQARQDAFVLLCFKSDAEWRALGEGGDDGGRDRGLGGDGGEDGGDGGESTAGTGTGDKRSKGAMGGGGRKKDGGGGMKKGAPGKTTTKQAVGKKAAPKKK